VTIIRTMRDPEGTVRLMADTSVLAIDLVRIPVGVHLRRCHFAFPDICPYASGERGFLYPARATFKGFTVTYESAEGCARDRIPPFIFELSLKGKGREPSPCYGFNNGDFSGSAHLASLRRTFSEKDPVTLIRSDTPFWVSLTTVSGSYFPSGSYTVMLDLNVWCGVDREAQAWLTDAPAAPQGTP